MGEYEERYEAARDDLEKLLRTYPDVFGMDLDMPSVGDYVLVAASDDIAEGSKGCIQIMYPPHQWRYRTIGLFEWAKEIITQNSRTDDPGG